MISKRVVFPAIVTMVLLAALVVAPVAAARTITTTGASAYVGEEDLTFTAVPLGETVMQWIHYSDPTAGTIDKTLTAAAGVIDELGKGIPTGSYYVFTDAPVADPSDRATAAGYVNVQTPQATLDVVLNTSHMDSVNGKTVTRSTVLDFRLGNNVDATVPLLPAEFSGTVTIDGVPAPAGIVITARIDGRDCGSLTLDTAGVYGGDGIFDRRLLVSGEDGDAGKTITFFVGGVEASGTAGYTPGTSTRLDLVATSGVDFSADVTAGPAPLTVRFTDQSTGDPESRYWEFGDGSTSFEENPEYTYRIPGTYTVNLTINTQTNPVTLSRPGYITVTPPRGDVTGDGIVDISDVSKVAYMVVGKEPADLAADFNGNERVDIGDAAKIAYFVVGGIDML